MEQHCMTQSKDEDFTFDISDLTINIGENYISDSDTITINMNDYVGDTIDISSITTTTVDTAFDINLDWASTITFDRVMFEDDMPDPQEIKRMCEEYPALEKAYENFKTIYTMVQQDWKGKQDDDEELPF